VQTTVDEGAGADEVERRRERLVRILAGAGLAGQVLITIDWIVSGLFAPGYSFVRNTISDLGAMTSVHAAPYNAALSVGGLLSLGLAAGLLRVRPHARRGDWTAGAIAVGVFSIGMFIDGLLREDCSPTVDASCRAAVDARTLSWHHVGHDLESVVTFVALIVAPLLLGLAFRAHASWRRLAPWGFAVFVFQVVALPVFLVLLTSAAAGVGPVEIAEVTAGIAFFAAVSIQLLRHPARPD
jgi:hypothetical membrane protein